MVSATTQATTVDSPAVLSSSYAIKEIGGAQSIAVFSNSYSWPRFAFACLTAWLKGQPDKGSWEIEIEMLIVILRESVIVLVKHWMVPCSMTCGRLAVVVSMKQPRSSQTTEGT